MAHRVLPETPVRQGRVVHLDYRSRVLEDNPWGDPTARRLPVYLPWNHDRPDAGPFPVLFDLAAYTNTGPGHLNWRNHGENVPQRLDRLIDAGHMPPTVVVFPDCYTALGGNQYVNSPALGAYEDYLVEELVPFLDERLDLDSAGRGLFGKSSGGYGALYLGMRHPQLFQAVAAHAPDVGFDRMFLGQFPEAARVLGEHDGDVLEFIRRFWRARRPSGAAFHTLLVLGLAASFDPRPGTELGFGLPFEIPTARLDPEAWGRWLAFDPLNLVDEHAGALRGLRGLWLDVGDRDQYHIQFGCRELHDRLRALDVDHRFEEFEGNHSGMDWRLDHSLPYLAAALKAGADSATS